MNGGQIRIDRRRLIRGTGALLAAGALAGCTGGGGSADPEDLTDEARQRVDAWLADTGNYDGEFTYTDPSPPYDALVDVGAQGNGGNLAFAPPAWVVPMGHKVVWEWSGQGASHNVVSADDSDFEFRSGDPKSTGIFERTFEETGVALYYCDPHRLAGMKGAVVVVE